MARTVDRIESRAALVEPPVILEPTEVSLPGPIPTVQPRGRDRIGAIVRPLLLIALFGGGYLAYQKVPTVYESVNNLAQGAVDWWNAFSSPFDPNKDLKVAPSGTPQFPPSVSFEYITPTTTGKSPQELAKEAGYNILWMDPNDTMGRTVFYDYRGGWGGGIGENYSKQNGTDGKTYRSLKFLTGQFVGFEGVEGSKDKYIIMRNPKSGEYFQKIRVDFEGKIFSTDGNKPTLLSVANLSFNNEGALSLGVNGRLEYVSQWSETQLRRILQPGDAVGIGITAVKGISNNVLHEEDNVVTATYEPYFAGSIGLRRFGGKAQIEKELASP